MTNLVDLSNAELEKKLLAEKDPAKVKEIVDVFNLHLKKKEAIRTNALSDIQDKILSQMDARMSKPDNFSNSDLINYYKVVNDSLSKSNESLDNMTVPQIQFNQQINITDDSKLDRASRQRVLDAVEAIMAKTQQMSEENTIIESTGEEIKNELN